jgi:hypothetical protein
LYAVQVSGSHHSACLPASLEADIQQAVPIQVELNSLDAQLTDLRNRRDALFSAIWDKLKRIRAGVKGIYGDDSSQYEMVGGTRMSERKPPARKPAAKYKKILPALERRQDFLVDCSSYFPLDMPHAIERTTLMADKMVSLVWAYLFTVKEYR